MKKPQSIMRRMDLAVKSMEIDRRDASECARGLSEWKKLKELHEEKINKLTYIGQHEFDFKEGD